MERYFAIFLQENRSYESRAHEAYWRIIPDKMGRSSKGGGGNVGGKESGIFQDLKMCEGRGASLIYTPAWYSWHLKKKKADISCYYSWWQW